MNIFLWVLQSLLALHTAAGAVYKFSHNAGQTKPSLKAIPDSVWKGFAIVELLCAACLLLPLLNGSFGILIPVAAIVIAVEMLIYSGIHLSSADSNYGPIIYWLVVALVCAFISYGRLAMSPLI